MPHRNMATGSMPMSCRTYARSLLLNKATMSGRMWSVFFSRKSWWGRIHQEHYKLDHQVIFKLNQVEFKPQILTLTWYLTFPAKCRMTKAGSMTGVGTKYLFPWCCCLNLANNVSSVAWGKLELRHREKEGWIERRGKINGQLQPNQNMSAIRHAWNRVNHLFLLALLIQQVEQASGLLADEVDTAHVVCVVDVVPRNSLCLVLLLEEARQNILVNKLIREIN